MLKKRTIGVLGAGGIAEQHLKRLSARQDVTVAGVCDIRTDAATKLAGKFGLPDARIYGDWRKMLADRPLDALYICLPPFAHSGEVEAAAGRGIHVFIEKPIALDVKTARSMVQAVERAGIVSQVGFHFRFAKGVRALKAMLDEKTAGRPTLFEGRYWCNMPGGEWWRDPQRSGGQIVEQVIHVYDLALHLLGPASFAAGLRANLAHTDQPDYKVEDTSAAFVQFASGAMASISASNSALPVHFHASWRVVCENAVLEYDSTGQPWVTPDKSALFTHGRPPKPDEVTKQEMIETDDLYAAETENFLAAIEHNRPAMTPIRHGLSALELVLAVAESAKAQGQPAAIDKH